MNYYAVEFANHVTLIVKSGLDPEALLKVLLAGRGLKHARGTIYNPKSFIALRSISTPDKREGLVAQELSNIYIG